MTMRFSALCVLMLAAGACGSDDLTGTGGQLPTVLVTNATCGAGRCATLEIRAFVGTFAVPGQLPTGWDVVGEAPPGQTCLTFPASWSMLVIGADTRGRLDTTKITWKPDDAAGISLVAVDSAAFHGSGGQALDLEQTQSFVPGDAPGWSVTFPADAAVSIASGAACTP